MGDGDERGLEAAVGRATPEADANPLVLRLPRLRLALEASDDDLRSELASTFSGLVSKSRADEHWVITDDEGWCVEAPGRAIDGRRAVSTASLAGRLQTELNNLVTATSCAAGDVLLHAGTLRLEARTVLLVGTSGAGKTTLTATLLDAGADYLSDEFTVLEPAGRTVRRYAKPLTVKQGARETVGGLELFAGDAGLADDEPGLRYVAVPESSLAAQGAWPSLLVLLDADPQIEEGWVHPAEVLIALAEHSPCRAQTTDQLPRLAEFAREVPAYQLARREPARMAATVRELLSGLASARESGGSGGVASAGQAPVVVDEADVAEMRDSGGSAECLGRAPGVLTEDFADAAVLYDPRVDRLHLLNARGRALWIACDGQQTLDDLVAAGNLQGLEAADVQETLRVFREEGLLAGGADDD